LSLLITRNTLFDRHLVSGTKTKRSPLPTKALSADSVSVLCPLPFTPRTRLYAYNHVLLNLADHLVTFAVFGKSRGNLLLKLASSLTCTDLTNHLNINTIRL